MITGCLHLGMCQKQSLLILYGVLGLHLGESKHDTTCVSQGGRKADSTSRKSLWTWCLWCAPSKAIPAITTSCNQHWRPGVALVSWHCRLHMSASDVHGRRNAVFPARQSQNTCSVCGQSLGVLPAHPTTIPLTAAGNQPAQTRQSPRQSDTAPGRLSMHPPQAVYHHPRYFIQSMPSTKPSWPSPNPRRPRHNTYRRRMHEVCVPTHIPTQSCANSPCNKMVIPFHSPG